MGAFNGDSNKIWVSINQWDSIQRSKWEYQDQNPEHKREYNQSEGKKASHKKYKESKQEKQKFQVQWVGGSQGK
jgi:hypothetical protein